VTGKLADNTRRAVLRDCGALGGRPLNRAERVDLTRYAQPARAGAANGRGTARDGDTGPRLPCLTGLLAAALVQRA